MRTCTKCSAEIRKGEKYHQTKLGSHHADCVSATMKRCRKRLKEVNARRWTLRCKENDNLIQWSEDRLTPAEPRDGEFWIADELGKSWVVIGLDDVLEALRLVGIGIVRK